MFEIDRDFETILICAVRYALGRRTYMPRLVIGYITPMLPMLSKMTLSVMEKDVMFEGDLGDEQIDKPSWMQFLKDIQKELKKRA
jgi:hypothetical protein